jgi:hypothetical protein
VIFLPGISRLSLIKTLDYPIIPVTRPCSPPTSFQVMNTASTLAGGPSTALPLIYDEGKFPSVPGGRSRLGGHHLESDQPGRI